MYKSLLNFFEVILLIGACKKENAGFKTSQINPVQEAVKVDWRDTVTINGKSLPQDAIVFLKKIPVQDLHH